MQEADTKSPPITAASAPAVIEVDDVHKSFGPLEVLKGVSVTAREGEVVALIGSSGSGKSTLLRCINMLEIPDSGAVRVAGEEIRLPSKTACPLKAGDVVRVIAGGGGGYGAPSDRSGEAIAADLLAGKATAAAVEHSYPQSRQA